MKKTWSLKSDVEMRRVWESSVKQFPIVHDSKEIEKTSAFFKGLGDETRLKIMFLLWMEDLCMCEIVAALQGAPSTISHHLKIMENGEIIESRREGKFTIYSLKKENLSQIMPFLNEISL